MRPAQPAGPGPAGLFAGLCTLDIIQLIAALPGRDEKITARRQAVAAGGPAANAAVTFAALGGRAVLVSAAGAHPLAGGIRADLAAAGVRLVDAAAGDPASPPVSSVFVTEGSPGRAVVSMNAAGRAAVPPAELAALAAAAGIVLVDAHHRDLALAAARAARQAGVPSVLDGGSWRDGTQELLSLVDVAICSADFRPPGVPGPVLGYLLGCGVRWAAVTSGAGPVRWAGPGGLRGEVPAVAVPVADTVAAGDVFHGAAAYHLAAAAPGRSAPGCPARRAGPAQITRARWQAALESAAAVAARSCRFFGTREWLAGWLPAAGAPFPP